MKRAEAISAVIVLAAVILLGGCAGEKPDASSVPDTDYQEVLPVYETATAVTEYITEQELTDILRIAVTVEGVYDDGETAQYASADGGTAVRISRREMTRTQYDEMIAALTGFWEDVAAIGETACWYNNWELFAYGDGAALEVLVTVPGDYVPKDETMAIAKQVLMAA